MYSSFALFYHVTMCYEADDSADSVLVNNRHRKSFVLVAILHVAVSCNTDDPGDVTITHRPMGLIEMKSAKT